MCDCKCVLSAKVHACYNTGKKKNSTKFCGDRRQKWHENSTDLQLILSLDMWAHSTYHALFVCYIVSCQNFVQFFFFFLDMSMNQLPMHAGTVFTVVMRGKVAKYARLFVTLVRHLFPVTYIV